MKRTRKWEYVGQEATRRFRLGQSPAEISKAIGVDKSTVCKWIKAGKFTERGESPKGQAPSRPVLPVSQWGEDIRSAYVLDVDDEELVKCGELFLTMRDDPLQPASVRLSAGREFRAVVKQLNLAARSSKEEQPAEPKPKPAEPLRRTGTDPRAQLMAVK